MAGQTEVFKEFLVKLGFKVDENSFKKYKDNINVADAATFALGEGIYKVTSKLADFALRSSSIFEKSYFQSRRLGSSAADIKGLEYAFGRLGVTTEEVGSALSGIRDFTLKNPGGSGYLQALGVQLKDVNDSAQTLKDLTDFVSKDTSPNKSYSANVLGQFGISPIMIQQMQDAVVLTREHQKLLEQIGVNYDQIGKESNDFNNTLSRTVVLLDGIGAKLYQWTFLAPFEKAKNSKNADKIDDAVPFLKSIDKLFGFPTAEARAGKENTSVAKQLSDAGFDQNAVAAIMGVSQGESGGNPNAVNPTSGAYGLYQFLGKRKQNLFAKYGSTPTASQQTQFAIDELLSPNSDDPQSLAVGKFLRGGHSVAENVSAFNSGFERPGFDPNYERKQQYAAQAASGAGATINQTNNYNITGAGAQETAEQVKKYQQQTVNILMRNLNGSTGN